jgi:hypothetical protein
MKCSTFPAEIFRIGVDSGLQQCCWTEFGWIPSCSIAAGQNSDGFRVAAMLQDRIGVDSELQHCCRTESGSIPSCSNAVRQNSDGFRIAALLQDTIQPDSEHFQWKRTNIILHNEISVVPVQQRFKKRMNPFFSILLQQINILLPLCRSNEHT